WETVLRTGYGLFFDTGTQRTGYAFLYTGYYVNLTYTKLTFPLPSQYYDIPAPTTQPPYQSSFIAFNPHLRLPYAGQWNFTIEQRLGSTRSLSVGYVGSNGRRMLTPQNYQLKDVNPDFANGLLLIDNLSYSDYHSLQTQFQQFLSHGMQLLLSYTWSHSIDNSSTSYNNLVPL